MNCPGYLDFLGEALSGLHAADCAASVIDAKDGVGVGTHQVWEYATQLGLTKFFVVNGRDKGPLDFERTLGQIRQCFGARVLPLPIPVNLGGGLEPYPAALPSL